MWGIYNLSSLTSASFIILESDAVPSHQVNNNACEFQIKGIHN